MEKKPLKRIPVPQHSMPRPVKTVRSIDSDTTEEIEEEVVTKQDSKIVYSMFGILILLGVGTGFLLSRGLVPGGPKATVVTTETTTENGKKVVGVSDAQTFKDSAEGTVEKGGLDGEGTHKLVRDGGPSQTVYLISSVVDLDEFVGKKIKVWGQTMSAKKVAWLMDVGKVEQE